MTNLKLPDIQREISTEYGLEVSEVSELEGGRDPFARTYKAVDLNGGRFFVKVRSRFETGIELSVALRDARVSNVLAPMHAKNGAISVPFGKGVLLVYPFIDGKNGFQRHFENRHWEQIGITLRSIHESHISPEILSDIAVETFRIEGIDRFTENVRKLAKDSDLSALKATMAQFFEERQLEISNVLETVDRMGKTCRGRAWDLVPSHADLHVGNILVDTSDSAVFIDWDSPRLAPRECDLNFFCDGGILGRHGLEEESRFFRGYGHFEPDPDAMAYYRSARIAEDLVVDTDEALREEERDLPRAIDAVNALKALFK